MAIEYYRHTCKCGFDGYLLRQEQAWFVVAACPGCGVDVLWQWDGIPLPPVDVTVDDVRSALVSADGAIDELGQLLGVTPEENHDG